MTRIIGISSVCALIAAFGGASAPVVHAQTPVSVTLTFKLTINGVAARGDSFDVTWGETGVIMCNAPCTGGGHTYVQTMTFPKGVTETFVFARASGGTAGVTLSRQEFLKQTVTASGDRTVGAFFTYGSQAVGVPSTGLGPQVLFGAAVTGSGVVLVGFAVRPRRRHRPTA